MTQHITTPEERRMQAIDSVLHQSEEERRMQAIDSALHQSEEERRMQAIDNVLHQSGIITEDSIRQLVDDAIETAIHQMAHQKIHVVDMVTARAYADKFDYDVLDLESGGFSIVTASAVGVWVVKVLPEKVGA